MIPSAAHLAAAIFSVSVDLVSTHQSLSKMLSLRLSAVPFGTKDIGQYCTQGDNRIPHCCAHLQTRRSVVECPLLSASDQIVAAQRLSAKCQKRTTATHH